jgi:hypothetical protein
VNPGDRDLTRRSEAPWPGGTELECPSESPPGRQCRAPGRGIFNISAAAPAGHRVGGGPGPIVTSHGTIRVGQEPDRSARIDGASLSDRLSLSPCLPLSLSLSLHTVTHTHIHTHTHTYTHIHTYTHTPTHPHTHTHRDTVTHTTATARALEPPLALRPRRRPVTVL